MIYADRTFINGKIYTMAKEGQYAEGMVIMDGKVLYIGSEEEVKKFPTKEVIDLKGKTVLPGLTDTHLHLVMDCEAKQKVNLLHAESIGEVIQLMKEKEKNLQKGSWLLGSSLHISRLKEERFPTRYELDEITRERPVLIQSYCGHAALVNSKALELAGIKNGFKPNVEGIIEFGEEGEPTGITRENAYNDYFVPLIGDVLFDYKYKKDALAAELRECSSYGFTCIQTYSSLTGEPLEYLYQYKELDEEGRLPLRIVLNSSAPLPKMIGAVTGIGNDKVKYGAKKIFSDGSLSSHSAALIEPYEDDKSMKGVVMYSQEELNQQVKDAYEYGMDVGVHVIGDHAMEMVLTAMENAYDPKAGRKNRFYLIHAMLVTKEHIERIKKLPAIINTQPIFIRNWVDLCEIRIGKERMKRFMPLQTYLDNGIIITGGSDAPVEEINPFIGIQCAVTRQNLAGFPEGGFVPEERISVYNAIAMFTKNAAYCTHEENIRGTLERGKFADFVVLDQDIFKIPVNEIHRIKVEKTILGGEVVYSC